MLNMVEVKSILNKHKKRDEWFLDDYSINPYRGCSFNCVYCYIRGSKYGENMEKTLSIKVNAPQLLEKQLRRRADRKEFGIILISSSTEPYLPVEEDLRITRRLLEIILKYRFPVHVVTKSALVLRDLDILMEIDKNAVLPEDLGDRLKRGAIISFSISTLNEELAKIFEPGAPTPVERLKAVKKCKEKGFLVGVNFIPVLPYLSDTEESLDEMIKAAKEYGADFVLVGSLTLFSKNPADCKTVYYKILKKYYPDLIPKYRSLFKIFSQPPKSYQEELHRKVEKITEKYNIRCRII